MVFVITIKNTSQFWYGFIDMQMYMLW